MVEVLVGVFVCSVEFEDCPVFSELPLCELSSRRVFGFLKFNSPRRCVGTFSVTISFLREVDSGIGSRGGGGGEEDCIARLTELGARTHKSGVNSRSLS